MIEYYSTLKRKENLTHATTWMRLKDIGLGELSWSQKGNYWGAWLAQSTEQATLDPAIVSSSPTLGVRFT